MRNRIGGALSKLSKSKSEQFKVLKPSEKLMKILILFLEPLVALPALELKKQRMGIQWDVTNVSTGQTTFSGKKKWTLCLTRTVYTVICRNKTASLSRRFCPKRGLIPAFLRFQGLLVQSRISV